LPLAEQAQGHFTLWACFGKKAPLFIVHIHMGDTTSQPMPAPQGGAPTGEPMPTQPDPMDMLIKDHVHPFVAWTAIMAIFYVAAMPGVLFA
jgi:hypothetical protein